jgi:hypothetical protein
MSIDPSDLNSRLFLYVVRCARRAQYGNWVLTLDEPHDDEPTQRQFMSELLSRWLTPADAAERNQLIEDSIKNTTTDPPE